MSEVEGYSSKGEAVKGNLTILHWPLCLDDPAVCRAQAPVHSPALSPGRNAVQADVDGIVSRTGLSAGISLTPWDHWSIIPPNPPSVGVMEGWKRALTMKDRRCGICGDRHGGTALKWNGSSAAYGRQGQACDDETAARRPQIDRREENRERS
jgi:hypothetical protein